VYAVLRAVMRAVLRAVSCAVLCAVLRAVLYAVLRAVRVSVRGCGCGGIRGRLPRGFAFAWLGGVVGWHVVQRTGRASSRGPRPDNRRD